MQSRIHKAVPMIAAISVAICLVMPFFTKPHVFPFTGYWVGDIVRHKDGVKIKAILGFHKDGTCSYSLQGPSGKTNYGCAYTMSSEKAQIRARYRKVYTVDCYSVVTPTNNGDILKLSRVKNVYLDEDTGKKETLNFRPEVIEMRKLP